MRGGRAGVVSTTAGSLVAGTGTEAQAASAAATAKIKTRQTI
jgi:hypothetical protein